MSFKLETERLIIRHVDPERDFEAWADCFADKETMTFIGGGPGMSRAHAWRHMATVIGHLHIHGYSFMSVIERRQAVGWAALVRGIRKVGLSLKLAGRYIVIIGEKAMPRKRVGLVSIMFLKIWDGAGLFTRSKMEMSQVSEPQKHLGPHGNTPWTVFLRLRMRCVGSMHKIGIRA